MYINVRFISHWSVLPFPQILSCQITILFTPRLVSCVRIVLVYGNEREMYTYLMWYIYSIWFQDCYCTFQHLYNGRTSFALEGVEIKGCFWMVSHVIIYYCMRKLLGMLNPGFFPAMYTFLEAKIILLERIASNLTSYLEIKQTWHLCLYSNILQVTKLW